MKTQLLRSLTVNRARFERVTLNCVGKLVAVNASVATTQSELAFVLTDNQNHTDLKIDTNLPLSCDQQVLNKFITIRL